MSRLVNMNITRRSPVVPFLAMLIAMIGLAGCAGPSFTGSSFGWLRWGRGIPSADARHPVIEILCLWEPGEGRGLDNLPTRGFAGQILFFTTGRPVPCQVDGDVRIYVFDDMGDAESNARPLHQFDFKPEAWATYLHETNIGGSYQLFIPYTRKGPHQAECAIRVRYTPRDGLPVYSKMANVVLSGSKSHRSPAVELSKSTGEPTSPGYPKRIASNAPSASARSEMSSAAADSQVQPATPSPGRLSMADLEQIEQFFQRDRRDSDKSRDSHEDNDSLDATVVDSQSASAFDAPRQHAMEDASPEELPTRRQLRPRAEATQAATTSWSDP